MHIMNPQSSTCESKNVIDRVSKMAKVGQKFNVEVEVVDDRDFDQQESMAVFISCRDSHENLLVENLFKVNSMRRVW